MAEIPTRTLGRTGVDVTILGYGGAEIRGKPFRGVRANTREEAETVLKTLLSSGVNYIDTAPDYGASEVYIGEFIASRRDEFFIASKCGCKPIADPFEVQPGDAAPHSYDRENILAGIHQSLKRLNTDHLDLVQFHMNPLLEDLKETGAIETLLEVKQQGKVRFLGCSTGLPNTDDHIDMGVFDVLLIPYSGLDRQHENVISRASQAGIGTVIRGGVADGPSTQVRPRLKWDDSLNDLLDGMSRIEFMLRFTMSHPDMNTTVVGTMRAHELAANVATAVRGPLPDDVYAEAKKRFSLMGSNPE